jgi:DNA replication licensing factor MCM6
MQKTAFFYRDELAEETSRIFFHFLENFDPNKTFESQKFFEIDIKSQLNLMKEIKTYTVYINFYHIIQFSDELADIIEEQFHRIESYISEAFYEFLINNYYLKNKIDFNVNKKFWVGFYNLPQINSIKNLNSSFINRLICISGIITRISEPYPEILYGSFKCANNNCGFILNFIEQDIIFKEPKICPKCFNLGNWIFLFEDSIFIFLQKIRIQEIEKEALNIDIPLTLDLILRDDFIGYLKIGDKCVFTGSLIILPKNKKSKELEKKFYFSKHFDFFNSFLQKIFFKTYFFVNHLYFLDSTNTQQVFIKKNYFKCFSNFIFFSQKEKKKILKLRIKKQLFKRLMSPLDSILKNAENIKLGILLLIVGGVSKKTVENLKIKGNLNFCLISDFFLKKHFFLRSIKHFFPRINIINGKRCNEKEISGSIRRQFDTDLFSIEAGKIAFSDQGICCVDNFDELTFENQIAINQVLEQEKVSIAKGNIKASMNVRASILGFIDLQKKYDKNKTLRKNSGLNFNIFSRFDLFFLNLDFSYKKEDLILSENIIFLNQKYKKNNLLKNHENLIIELYLSFARLLKPIIKHKSGLLIIRIYKYLRKCQFLENSKNTTLTIRHLESLIRLSEALSKLYLGLYVKKFHVKAAARLLFNSIYPFNKSSKKLFRKSSETNVKIFKKKKIQKSKSKKKTIKISFFEFRIIFRNIIAEIKSNKNKGFLGIKLNFLIKRLLQSSFFMFSFEKKIFKIRKIIMIIRFMIFSYHNLILIKCLIDNEKTKFIKLIYLKN